jgi:predicted DNA-binding WGR domain protein
MGQSANQVEAGARRELVFQEGGSNKFWNIELSGSSFTVTFGRVGTAGQQQTKEFANDEAAKKACDKLIAEKLKKGYTDAAGTSDGVAVVAAPKATAKPKSKLAKAADEQPTESVPVKAAVPAPDLSIERRIDLEPADWARATFRPRKVLERGEPQPFDQEACCARVAKLRTEYYGWNVKWQDLKLPPAMTREEAHYWLEAMTTPRQRDDSLKGLAEKLAKKNFTGELSADEVAKLLSRAERGAPDEATLAVTNLISIEEYLELLLQGQPQGKHKYQIAEAVRALMYGFNTYVLPYLTDKELHEARQPILKKWDPTKTPADLYESLPTEYYLAAALGMHEQVYEVTSTWPDDRYAKEDWADHYHRPQDMVFGLATSDLVAAEWRRLKLRMRSGEHVRAFLACTEYADLDCVRDSILAETNREKCEELVQALARVHAPEAAAPMLECKLGCKTPGGARSWLDANVAHAVSGLVQAAGSRGKLAEAAIDFLRGIKRQGHAESIASALKKLNDADAAAKVQREVLDQEEKTYEPFTDTTVPAWLKEGLDAAIKVKAHKLPRWAVPANLPPLPLGEQRLSDEQLGTVLNVLAATPVQQRDALLSSLREHIDTHARDEFAWKLFQNWMEDGAPSKEKWAMGTIGQLGGDGCALKLTPLVRAWPGESQHQRAVFGLECLRAIGSDAALMQLAGCAQKLKFKGLKAKAEEFVNEIAVERGMTRAELEDRVVPDCGLDEAGRREFSFGPRSFSFVLGADLKAMVKDESGKARGDLPKPGAKDDAALAEQALADWKLMKKQIKEVATIQAGRLEQAMVTGRRWKVHDFVTLLVQHPLLTHLARSLIWGSFDAKGQRLATFRVTEERDFADVKDNALSLEQASAVGVLHPLEIPEGERSAWGEVLGDYEIVSPFPQFGRAIYKLEPGEEKADDLKRFHGLKLVAPTLVFTLEKLGWLRGMAMDAGCFDEHSKQFQAADVTAIVGYEGTVGMGYIDPNEMLTITSVQFVDGMRPPSGYGWDKKKVSNLGSVPPVVMSEVLADLQVLKSKAK